MQKAELQQVKMQDQPAAQQRGGVVVETPQTEQIAQLEAMIAASPHQAALQKVADEMHNSPRQRVVQDFSEGINNSPLMVVQQMRHEQMFGVAQRLEDKGPLQGKFAAIVPAQLVEAKPNNTGLPDNLKFGIENLSGMSMDNVKVHYNSAQPAQLNALAYAQGSDIHVAPGQEQHLPHEAWHVVQQAQDRVKPTMQMKEGVPVNADKGLEHEADVMGVKALEPAVQLKNLSKEESLLQGKFAPVDLQPPVLQRYRTPAGTTNAGMLISNNEGIIQVDRKNVYAKARSALAAVNSYVTVMGGTTKKGKALQRVTLEWNPQNVPARSHHEKVSEANRDGHFTRSFADCHRSAQTVMGSSSGGEVDTENPVISSAGRREIVPSTTRLEAKGKHLEGAHANRGAYAFFVRAMPAFARILEAEGDEIHTDLIEQLDGISWSELDGEKVAQCWTLYARIMDNDVTSQLFSKSFGVNEFAAPEVGDALTQVNNETERKNAPEGVDLWNFHWAGVIMKDGADYVTLENLSVENEDVLNPSWYFRMYGAGKQSFHTQQSDPSNAGSEHVGKSPLTLGFRNTPKVSEAARGEYAAKEKAAHAQVLVGSATSEHDKAKEELAAAKALHIDPEAAAVAARLALVAAESLVAQAKVKADATTLDLQNLGDAADFAAKKLARDTERMHAKATEDLEYARTVVADPQADANEKYQAACEAAEEASQALDKAVKVAEATAAAVESAKVNTKAKAASAL